MRTDRDNLPTDYNAGGKDGQQEYERPSFNTYSEDELNEVEDDYYALPDSERSRTRLWSVLSLTLGILSVILCPFWYVGIALGAISVLFAVISGKLLGFFDGIALWGLIIGICGLVFSLGSMALTLSGALAALGR